MLMRISYQPGVVALVTMLATSDPRALTPPPLGAPRGSLSSQGERGLILAVDQGERRMRRPVSGAPFINAPFIIKVDRVNGRSPDLVMGYEVLPPGAVIQGHRHPHADEILFVQYGRAVAALDGRSAPIGLGATIYIPHDVTVSLRVGPDSLGLVFVFSHPGFEQYLRDVSVLEGQLVVPLSDTERKAIRERHQTHVVYEQP